MRSEGRAGAFLSSYLIFRFPELLLLSNLLLAFLLPLHFNFSFTLLHSKWSKRNHWPECFPLFEHAHQEFLFNPVGPISFSFVFNTFILVSGRIDFAREFILLESICLFFSLVEQVIRMTGIHRRHTQALRIFSEWEPMGANGIQAFLNPQRGQMGLGRFKRCLKPAKPPNWIQVDPIWSCFLSVVGVPAPVYSGSDCGKT